MMMLMMISANVWRTLVLIVILLAATYGEEVYNNAPIQRPVLAEPERRFLIFSQPRSGTGWLVSLLASHRRVACSGELIKAGPPHFVNGSCDSDPPSWLETKHVLDRFFFGKRRKLRATKLVSAAGFKVMYQQYFRHCNQALRDYVIRHNIYVVRLVRRNKLRQAISLQVMRDDKLAKLNEASRKHPQTTKQLAVARQRLATMHPTGVAAMLANLQSQDAQTDQLFASLSDSEFVQPIKTHTMYYEDVVADPQHQLRLLQLFLGLDPKPLNSSLLKLHERETPVDELVTNPEQLRAQLAASKYRNFYF
jgi:LPS sulfotransferase NodH